MWVVYGVYFLLWNYWASNSYNFIGPVKHNRSLKVAVFVPVFGPPLYIHKSSKLCERGLIMVQRRIHKTSLYLVYEEWGIVCWRVLRLWMEGTASRCGGYLRIYWISSRGQPTRGGPQAWGLGLTTPHRKNYLVTKIHKKPRKLRGGWIWVMLATIQSRTFCLLICCLKT
jgi:hypothetical protein